MAMRDPSLVAAKADIRQQAIKGGEVPQADLSRRNKKVHYSITSSAEMRRERAQPLD